MTLRILFISANTLKIPYPVYPLATAYLKPYIEEHLKDCKVDLIDMNLASYDDIKNYIIENKPSYICISLRNVDGVNSINPKAFFKDYKRLCDFIKSHSNAPIIIGGAGFSIFPQQFINELGADYGTAGEGEASTVALIEALENNKETKNIPRLYKANGEYNHICEYISSPQARYDDYLVEYYWKQSGMLNIQTKRGCPFNCIYCTYPRIDGRKIRTMNIDLLIDNIARAKRDFGANYWFFTDSVFNISKRYNIELCEALVKSNLNIKWGAYFAPKNMTNDEMELFARSGLTHIEFGTESFSDRTLEAYGKNFTFDEVLFHSELALKHNIYYSHFMILAGWGETKEQLYECIENSKHLRHTVIFPFVGMRIYPHTRLYDYCIEEKVISPDTNLIVPHFYTAKDFDLEETRKLAKATEKAWIFPDEPEDKVVQILRSKKNKKGPLWEYLRKA